MFMLNILTVIEEWIKGFLIGCISGNLNGMFQNFNSRVGEVAQNVGKTPQEWDSGIFTMIQSLSNTVIVPVAGMILTFVLCYELISMLIEKNNMHEIDTWVFFKWIIKTMIAVYLVTHTFDMIIAIFELGQNMVSKCAEVIQGSFEIDLMKYIKEVDESLKLMELPELFLLLIESTLIRFTMFGMSIAVMLVLYGRMIEIYIYSSIGAIPFSTMVNREWGSMGTNYLRGIIALSFQGFFIMVCVAIYMVLIQRIATAENIHTALWTCGGYAILLCFSLSKTASVSKSIFNAH